MQATRGSVGGVGWCTWLGQGLVGWFLVWAIPPPAVTRGVHRALLVGWRPCFCPLRPWSMLACHGVLRGLQVYRSVGSPLLDKAFGGYNATIFAYGQTGGCDGVVCGVESSAWRLRHRVCALLHMYAHVTMRRRRGQAACACVGCGVCSPLHFGWLPRPRPVSSLTTTATPHPPRVLLLWPSPQDRARRTQCQAHGWSPESSPE